MPTFTGGRNAKILTNGSDLSSYFKTASAQSMADTTETTAFGDQAKVFIPVIRDGTFSADGMLQSGTTTIDGVLTAALGTDGTNLTYFPAGDALGATGTGLQGVDTSHSVSSPVDGVASVSMSLQSTVGAEPLTAQHAWSAESANGTATAVDGGAASTLGACSYLHAQVVGGTLTVKLQDSADNSTFADVLVHTAVTGVAGTASERLAATGTLRRYTRTLWTLNGGTATFQASAGRIPKIPN